MVKKIFFSSSQFFSELQHPSVVRLLGLYRDSSDAYMVMEYVSKGSLLDVLKKESKVIEFKDQMDM
jgi:serine/threonine protein kinase